MRNGIIKIEGETLFVDIAESGSDRQTGLMDRGTLLNDHGMLFIQPAGNASFWMKNTLIPLDIAYADESRTIVKIDSMAPKNGKSKCNGNIVYAIEANQGWFSNNGIAVGCTFDLLDANDIVESVFTKMLGNI